MDSLETTWDYLRWQQALAEIKKLPKVEQHPRRIALYQDSQIPGLTKLQKLSEEIESATNALSTTTDFTFFRESFVYNHLLCSQLNPTERKLFFNNFARCQVFVEPEDIVPNGILRELYQRVLLVDDISYINFGTLFTILWKRLINRGYNKVLSQIQRDYEDVAQKLDRLQQLPQNLNQTR